MEGWGPRRFIQLGRSTVMNWQVIGRYLVAMILAVGVGFVAYSLAIKLRTDLGGPETFVQATFVMQVCNGASESSGNGAASGKHALAGESDNMGARWPERCEKVVTSSLSDTPRVWAYGLQIGGLLVALTSILWTIMVLLRMD